MFPWKEKYMYQAPILEFQAVYVWDEQQPPRMWRVFYKP